MATKKNNTNKSKKPTTPKAEVKPPEDNITVTPEAEKPMVAKAINLNQFVTVKNGYAGKLVYRSSKTGERFVWEGLGDEQDMEFGELRSARGTGKKYYENNWFMFDDPEIVESLGVTKFYKFALKIDEFDTLFDKSVSEIKSIVAKLSDGQKKSVAYRAKQMISDGRIDSRKTISVLEEALGVELIEK